jgi:hypothetical protein
MFSRDLDQMTDHGAPDPFVGFAIVRRLADVPLKFTAVRPIRLARLPKLRTALDSFGSTPWAGSPLGRSALTSRPSTSEAAWNRLRADYRRNVMPC